eukprot:m.28540 g.28540  ORF g.28540 m.28540 type:complete len:94 (-) comp6564_c0_seq1:96-377(-)
MPEQVLWAVVCYDNRIQFNSLYHDESCFCLSFVHFLLVLVWLDMSNLFIVACRERTLIYLEPNHDDLVQVIPPASRLESPRHIWRSPCRPTIE